MTALDFSRARWRKSTRTGAANGSGGNCVELAALPPALWRKASTSSANSGDGQCVELAGLPNDLVGIRDSKQADGPVLLIDHAEATALYHLATGTG